LWTFFFTLVRDVIGRVLLVGVGVHGKLYCGGRKGEGEAMYDSPVDGF
jgi:hypothetical protein